MHKKMKNFNQNVTKSRTLAHLNPLNLCKSHYYRQLILRYRIRDSIIFMIFIISKKLFQTLVLKSFFEKLIDKIWL